MGNAVGPFRKLARIKPPISTDVGRPDNLVAGIHISLPDTDVTSEVSVGRVMPGMVFMDDLRTSVGTLLVPKGFEVTETFLERMRNFGSGILQERVRVMSAPKHGS